MRRRRHRLALRIYLALLGVILLSLFVALLAGRVLLGPTGMPASACDALLQLMAEDMPEPTDAATLQTWASSLSQRIGLPVAIRSPDGRLLASSGAHLPAPDPDGPSAVWRREQAQLARWQRLPNGYWLGTAPIGAAEREVEHLIVLMMALTALGLGAYPVAKRITRRLERLRQGVDALGRGDLSARVEVKGRDEVAQLAQAFNNAASRIAALVEHQKRSLAIASHELRSPLARLRMALELLTEDRPPGAGDDLVENARRDIEELDGLIGDLLLSSRLESRAPLHLEPVEVFALVDEETSRIGGQARGVPAQVSAEPTSLRRLVRNLVENARRYGKSVAVGVETEEGRVRIVVDDDGPGVPPEERDKIFQPFYRVPGHREGQGGVGLGLSLVKQIAQAHGGDVRCTERPGGGGRFVVDLPAGP